ncbi:MAG: ATP-binding protein, partial [Acidobacteria bacterium ACB2]|nr:ATP-binding protein [Acidobacteria bacterium ACB2]
MQGYLARQAEQEVLGKLRRNPVVAIVGPRQCGKTTLARRVLERVPGGLYVDLERPSDAARLSDPEAFFRLHADETVCLDEVQRIPGLFPVLRSVVDERRRNGQVLVLGSASPDLLRQSSETLAGRISFLELTPFHLTELFSGGVDDALGRLWLRGGFPRSTLAATDEESLSWRDDFVRTFLERDVPQLRPRVAVPRVASFWRMCAHEHGQTLNGARLGAALGVSSHTIRAYLELLESTFMVRLLPPFEANLGKRLVKSPRLYLRDTGILHALLGVGTPDDLLGHPGRGASWEGL